MARIVPGGWETEEDEWVEQGWHRHGHAPAPQRRPVDMLAPDRYYSGGLRRSRSTGARPAPNVTVYQSTRNELDHSPPGRSRSRRRHHDDEDVVDVLDDIRHAISRDRSRGRDPSPYYNQMQMELVRERERNRAELERERAQLEAELERDRLEYRERSQLEIELARTRQKLRDYKSKHDEELSDDKWKRDREIERLTDEAKRRNEDMKRKDERERLLAELEREEREQKERRRRDKLEWERKEEEEEEERKRVVNEFKLKEDHKRKAEKEKEEAAIAAYKKKQDEDKKKRQEMIAQIKKEEEEAKDKAKKEKEMWKLKIEEEERAEKEKKKKAEEAIQEEMRKRLAKVGFQNNQVEAILDPKKGKEARPGTVPSNALVIGARQPTYIRIKRTHVDVETLRYFQLPWEYDASDSDYIVILQEMESHETELLFEHTRRLRKGASTLLIEDRGRKNQPQYAWVKRRPSASPSRRKASPKRTIRLI